MTTPPPSNITVNSVFGEDLPRESADERDLGVGAEREERDRWLRDNVPPHHL